MPDTLAAHTPSSDYLYRQVQRRVLQHLGANPGYINTVAPEPYKSEYPIPTKLIDSVLTLTLDPMVKPLSIAGKLDQVPVLKKLAKELSDTGYFRKYPKGGIGIGGGGGSEGAGVGDSGPGSGPGVGVSQPGPDFPDPTEPNAETVANTASSRLGDLSSMNVGAAARGATGTTGFGSLAGAALSAIAAALGLTGAGLGFGAIGLGTNAALGEINAAQARSGLAFNTVSDAIASARGASGVGGPQGGGGQGSPGDPGTPSMTTTTATPPASSGASASGSSVSPTTRANAAARVGGGIAPDFLRVLQSLNT